VSEVASLVGFDDASNFSSYFHRRVGMTPGTFRTRSRTGHLSVPAG
jgi:AraC-like DNA-binding protein